LDLRSKLIRPNRMKEAITRLASPVTGLTTSKQRVFTLLRAVDRVFAISRYTADLVWRAARRDAVVTGCGISEESWERECSITPEHSPSEKQVWRKVIGIAEGPTVGFVGRLVPSKNVALLLQALCDLPDVQAVIVGDGSCSASLRMQAESLGVARRVHWLGSQDEQTKWASLRAMDVFCLPSKELPTGAVEGFGIVLLEATAAGTPVVAARSGGMVDVVEDRVTGLLCDPLDAKSLASAIARLIQDPCLAAQCVLNARRQIRDRFNWDTVAHTVLDSLNTARGGIGGRRMPSAAVVSSALRR
jgi:glycosyltransferase involved in cell wall biosynthesis